MHHNESLTIPLAICLANINKSTLVICLPRVDLFDAIDSFCWVCSGLALHSFAGKASYPWFSANKLIVDGVSLRLLIPQSQSFIRIVHFRCKSVSVWMSFKSFVRISTWHLHEFTHDFPFAFELLLSALQFAYNLLMIKLRMPVTVDFFSALLEFVCEKNELRKGISCLRKALRLN